MSEQPGQLAARLNQIIPRAIEQHIFPGAVVLVARNSEVCHAAAYGTTMYGDDGSQSVQLDTRYDIASLTKVFTATAALRLYDEGALALDEPAARSLPGLRARGVTVRHLLNHTSGLSLRLSALREQRPSAIRSAVYAVEPHHPPGTHIAYVNINSLLLGDIVANLSGMPLDAAIARLVLEPLAMRDTMFCPPASLRPHIAPTEWDHAWRGGLVRGQVHDDSASALGGVAGHAGLFSNAADLLRFTQMWLDGGRTPRGETLLRPATAAMAATIQTTSLVLPTEGVAFHCGLGWMIEHPIIMLHAPDDTYGHTGFTGPAIVNVPSHRLSLVILSNRTYPRRSAPTHHAITAAALEAALESLP